MRGLVLLCLIAAWCLALPDSGHAEDLDLVLFPSEQPFGEAGAGFAFGSVALTARHIEYLGYLNRSQDDGQNDEGDPLVRSSRFGGTSRLDLGAGGQLPVGLSVALDEWESGQRDLRMTAKSGLRLDRLSADHRFTVTTRFSEQGAEERQSAGRLALGLAGLPGLGGGRQQGIVEYDVAPLPQITLLGMNAEWLFDEGSAAQVALTHRPLDRVSEGRLGFRQPLGPFELTSDLSADSDGACAIGFALALPLGPEPEPVSWSLAELIGSLQDDRPAAGWTTPGGEAPFSAN